MQTTLKIAGGVAVVLLASAGAVQAFGERGYMGFKGAMGGPGGGDVEWSAIEERVTARFNRMDTDGDGFISEKDIAEQVKQRVEKKNKRMQRKFDTDKDGKISKDEFLNRARERFSWNDLNDDGKITADERPEHHMRGKGGKGKGRYNRSGRM
jgi:hypothetical protein